MKHNPHLVNEIRRRRKLFDHIYMVVAIIYPLTTIPQAYVIFANQSAVNVSLATWLLYLLFNVFYLLYAVAENLRPLIVEGVLWFIMNMAVIAGIVIYA